MQADPGVAVSVQNADEFEQLRVTELPRMKAGEPLIYVARGDRERLRGELWDHRAGTEPFW